MPDPRRGDWKIVALMLAVLAIAAGVLLVLDTGQDAPNPPPAPTTQTIAVPGPDIVADRDNQLEPPEVAESKPDNPAAPVEKDHDGLDFHEDTRDETPPGVTPAEVEAGRKKTEAAAEQVLVEPEEPAGAQAYSCPFHGVRNYSNLNARIVGVMLHFTVSSPGSLDAIRRLFDTSSFGASSTFGFELYNLRCEQWVRLDKKAWAQGAANSYYWSIEIVTKDLTRAQWLATPALKRGVLAALVADLLKKAGAPVRFVDPKGCVWPAGVTDHDHAECGNTHWDVGKNFPWDVFIAQVRRAYNGASPVCDTRCRRVKALRAKHARTHARWRKNRCGPEKHGYCDTLRNRNRAIHQAAERERIVLKR